MCEHSLQARESNPEIMLPCRLGRPRSCRLGRHEPASAAALISYAPLQQQLRCASCDASAGCCAAGMPICVTVTSADPVAKLCAQRGSQHRHCSAHAKKVRTYNCSLSLKRSLARQGKCKGELLPEQMNNIDKKPLAPGSHS